MLWALTPYQESCYKDWEYDKLKDEVKALERVIANTLAFNMSDRMWIHRFSTQRNLLINLLSEKWVSVH